MKFVLALIAALLLAGSVENAQAHPRPFPKWWLKGALCIHGHEGSWRDTGAPHWGGMQMDYSFMETYGGKLLRRKGTANNWTPHEQLHVAYRAYRSGRDWYPWPNTARKCGLI